MKGFELDPESAHQTRQWIRTRKQRGMLSPGRDLNTSADLLFELDNNPAISKRKDGMNESATVKARYNCPLCSLAFSAHDVISIQTGDAAMGDEKRDQQTTYSLGRKTVSVRDSGDDENSVATTTGMRSPRSTQSRTINRSPSPTRAARSGNKGSSALAHKEVRAWGYLLTRQAALLVAECYRDAHLPLTKTVRSFVFSYFVNCVFIGFILCPSGISS